MRTTVVVIGAGQAGLATSWWLAARAIDHVVLERGGVANTWRTERWPSLTLLTPNWQSRLPGFPYADDAPDGFRTLPQTIDLLERYAASFSPPLRLRSPVESVRRLGDGYEVVTPRGTWQASAVVLATGAFNRPNIPALAAALPPDVTTLTPTDYRSPAQLPGGGVLIVGAAATGAQLADEIQRSGRQVTLAVGEHVRGVRTYRGRDIQWWMEAAGLNDERYDQVENLTRARNLPSFQLTGQADRRDIDLNALTSLGVRLVGRLVGIRDGKAQLSGSLRNVCELADLKLNRLLNTFDAWAEANPAEAPLPPPHRPVPTRIEASPPLLLDFARHDIRTVVWATGFRPDYSWLKVPVVDQKGRLRHDGGVVIESPGLYVIGLPFLRRRKSSLIDGVGDDARDLSGHLATYLASCRAAA